MFSIVGFVARVFGAESSDQSYHLFLILLWAYLILSDLLEAPL
jgi:hypothetical protein